MTELLIRTFIKDSGAVHDPVVRERYGRLSGGIGIVLNLLLCLGKLLVGLATGSIAVTADALNNLSDAGSSVVTLVGFRLAGRQADREHPFGHGRMEYLSGLFVSLMILLVGVELVKTSLEKVLHPETVGFSAVMVAVLGASIAIKLWLSFFNRTLSRRIGSAAMAATAADALSDVVATAAVLAGAVIGKLTGLGVDGWTGLLVALFILRAGWGAAKETLDPLLGQSPDPELVRQIQGMVLAHRQVVGMHDLVIHDYGPGRRMMSFHAEVPMDADIMEVHDEIDAIERELCQRLGLETSIHMDPIATDDERIQSLRAQVVELVRGIDPCLGIHDFRMTAGPKHTNLIFDVAAPPGCALSAEEIQREVGQAVSRLEGPYFAVIQVDRAYLGDL